MPDKIQRYGSCSSDLTLNDSLSLNLATGQGWLGSAEDCDDSLFTKLEIIVKSTELAQQHDD